MNTEQKLTKIREKCVELWAIAEKRTHGDWNTIESEGDYFGDTLIGLSSKYEGWQDDCSFIASCAGPAEAGWKATIAAIDGIKRCSHCGGSGITDGWRPSYSDPCNSGMAKEAEPCCEHIKEIIAAWEGLV